LNEREKKTRGEKTNEGERNERGEEKNEGERNERGEEKNVVYYVRSVEEHCEGKIN
jgi:hypothetical protein